MLFERVAAWVFERSTGPVDGILACGVVGALLFLGISLEWLGEFLSWWLASAVGALIGIAAGGALALWEVNIDPA